MARKRLSVPAGLAGLLLVVPILSLAAADDEDSKPLDLGKTETVEVRLVTVDVLVLDVDDRTVPDLSAEDFLLEVDGRSVAVDTLDVACEAGALGAPHGGDLLEGGEPPGVAEAERRVVFVFDYLHLPDLPCPDADDPSPCHIHTRVLRQMQQILAARPDGAEEVMIAALDGGLRIEQGFTRDREAAVAALARMERDVTLFAGNFQHANEQPLLLGIETLLDVLDAVPGSKALVLFSGGAGPGDGYDLALRRIRDLAAVARTSIYPVDCQGLSARGFS